jgi:putative flippase GtrA
VSADARTPETGSAQPESQASGSRFGETRAIADQIVRFLGVGVISFPMGIGVSAFLHEILAWSEEASVGTAMVALLATSFALSRSFIFRATGPARLQLARFLVVALAARTGEYLLFLALLQLAGLPYLWSMTSALLISLSLKFLAYRVWVFSATSDAPER